MTTSKAAQAQVRTGVQREPRREGSAIADADDDQRRQTGENPVMQLSGGWVLKGIAEPWQAVLVVCWEPVCRPWSETRYRSVRHSDRQRRRRRAASGKISSISRLGRVPEGSRGNGTAPNCARNAQADEVDKDDHGQAQMCGKAIGGNIDQLGVKTAADHVPAQRTLGKQISTKPQDGMGQQPLVCADHPPRMRTTAEHDQANQKSHPNQADPKAGECIPTRKSA